MVSYWLFITIIVMEKLVIIKKFSGWRNTYIIYYSVYYSIITIKTVGYGDFCPSNNIEKIYAIFFLILAFLAFLRTLWDPFNKLFRINKKEYKIMKKKWMILQIIWQKEM